MRALKWASSVAAGGALALSSAAQSATPDSAIFGVWWDHHQNVKVETRSCGRQLCGTIVWATAQAIKEAKAVGTDPLVGLQVFSGFHRTAAANWEGRVFVPDLKRTFFSRIEQTGPDTLKIGGCILGGLICKTKIWTRTGS